MILSRFLGLSSVFRPKNSGMSFSLYFSSQSRLSYTNISQYNLMMLGGRRRNMEKNSLVQFLPMKPLGFRFKSECPNLVFYDYRDFNLAFLKNRIGEPIHSTPPNLVFYDKENLYLKFLSVDGNLEPHLSLELVPKTETWVTASCNGLLAVYNGKQQYLYNPVTRETHFIPDPPLRDIEEKFKGHRIEFFYYKGLAFDPLSKANPCYKLVYPFEDLVYRSHEHVLRFLVFSSETNEWELSRANIIVSYDLYFGSHSFYIGGLLYWKIQYSHSIVEFNPDGNHATLIPLPPEISTIIPLPLEIYPDVKHANLIPPEILLEKGVDREYEVAIGEWEGTLCCTTIIGGRNKIELWIMNEDKEFSKMYSIGLETVLRKKEVDVLHSWPLPCEGGKVLLFCMGSAVFSYDPETEELREFHMPVEMSDGISPCDYYCPNFMVYKKSLVPLPTTPNEP
ncbi:uncharacterized protein LOC143847650 [Tasmannia lanceolata]|uniref:uncharacterized protein LOC143847650 n=1 Tax=Tasmannia lanceolata TaxID=3420 RepID=UPI0040635FC7